MGKEQEEMGCQYWGEAQVAVPDRSVWKRSDGWGVIFAMRQQEVKENQMVLLKNVKYFMNRAWVNFKKSMKSVQTINNYK